MLFLGGKMKLQNITVAEQIIYYAWNSTDDVSMYYYYSKFSI